MYSWKKTQPFQGKWKKRITLVSFLPKRKLKVSIMFKTLIMEL